MHANYVPKVTGTQVREICCTLSEECHVILLIHYSAWVPLGKPKNSAKQEGWTTRVTLYAPSTLVSGA